MSGIYDRSSIFPSYPSQLHAALGNKVKSQKRRVYFAFHFDDIMRVNNVRQAWKIDHPDAPQMRSFYDSSLWEARQLHNSDSIKNLIHTGVQNTSTVCVLVGSNTWSRRWVRYEIARAVIDGRGLLAVHLNSIPHHLTRQALLQGPNPLGWMAVGKVQTDSGSPFPARAHSLLGLPSPQKVEYYLFERTGQGWTRYQDYTNPVNLPRYLADPMPGYVIPLSTGTACYDYIYQAGHKHIGAWIDHAAQLVGR